jgi:HEAT repeat protein
VERYASLPQRNRVAILELLARLADPRAEPAFEKALKEYLGGSQRDAGDLDLKFTAQAMAELKLPSLANLLFECFVRFEAHTQQGGRTFRKLNEALMTNVRAEWARTLIQMLERPIVLPRRSDDVAAINQYRDELFWQTTAAEGLGRIGRPEAVKPLLRLMLDPSKADVQATALLGLVKLGRPTIDAAADLASGRDAGLVQLHRERVGQATDDESHVRVAAVVLGTTGRRDAVDPLLTALSSAKRPVTRATIARELTKLPATGPSRKAFWAVYDGLPPETRLVDDKVNALEVLTEMSAYFFVSEDVDRLLARLKPPATAALRSARLITAIKLALPKNFVVVQRAVDQHGATQEKAMWLKAEALLRKCQLLVDCYLGALTEPTNQAVEHQFVGIKAAYAIAMLGDRSKAPEIVRGLDTVTNPAVRFVAAFAIDHLTPDGDRDTARLLDELISRNEKQGSRELKMADMPLRQTLYRIRARAL